MEAFLVKYRSEPDAAKKKDMLSTHTAEHAEKRKADPAGIKSKFVNDFFGMFVGFCAENPTMGHICKNKQLLHFKSINKIPPFNKKPSKPVGVAAASPKRKLDAGA